MGSAQIQGDLWGTRAGEWADLQEGSFLPLYEAGFSAAHVDTGTSLLDVGCGAGLALEMAQARGAKVSGLDAAAGLVELAKSRCPGADIRVGEIEELPFGDGKFDATTGFNSFQYATVERRRATSDRANSVTVGVSVAWLLILTFLITDNWHVSKSVWSLFGMRGGTGRRTS